MAFIGLKSCVFVFFISTFVQKVKLVSYDFSDFCLDGNLLMNNKNNTEFLSWDHQYHSFSAGNLAFFKAGI